MADAELSLAVDSWQNKKRTALGTGIQWLDISHWGIDHQRWCDSRWKRARVQTDFHWFQALFCGLHDDVQRMASIVESYCSHRGTIRRAFEFSILKRTFPQRSTGCPQIMFIHQTMLYIRKHASCSHIRKPFLLMSLQMIFITLLYNSSLIMLPGWSPCVRMTTMVWPTMCRKRGDDKIS